MSIASVNVSNVSAQAKIATNIVNGTNQVVRGSVKAGEAVYQHASDEHMVQSAKYENVQRQADRQQERMISGLRELSKSYEHALETLANTMNESQQTSVMLARQIA